MGLKQVILVRHDLKLGKGKLAAQASHASVSAFLKAMQKDEEAAKEWLDDGQPKIVLKVNGEKELLEFFEALKKQFPTALITDAGRTQIASGTKTCVGAGPAEENALDKITGKLKLL
ncbi:peptidyl-tRNA hydrolase [archaeon]|nr:peptidyl-tRNA hydrolase [archaeon]